MQQLFLTSFLILSSATVWAQTTLPPVLGNPSHSPVYSEDNTITLTSSRTGIEYTLSNPQKIKYVMQVEKPTVANEQNAKRIMAKNPALSEQSQELARQELLKK